MLARAAGSGIQKAKTLVALVARAGREARGRLARIVRLPERKSAAGL